MLFLVYCLISFFNLNSSFRLNIYTSLGQVQKEIVVTDGRYRTYFSEQEYQAIIPGTIDFPGLQMIEQDFYNANEELRDSNVCIRSIDGSNCKIDGSTLIDPHSLLIKSDSLHYSYVSRNQLEFNRDPRWNGMILSVRFNETSSKKASITYLMRDISWTPRYELFMADDQMAKLRALADIHNEQTRSYEINSSQLITGTVPIVSYSTRSPSSGENLRAEFMSTSNQDSAGSISSRPESANFGTYAYNITRPFRLLPKSIKTFPFLTADVLWNQTLEISTYLSAGINSGLFQKIFYIQLSEFLPAGTLTFYSATTGFTLGQARLPDTPANSEQKLNLGNDPDVKYQIIAMVTATRQVPTYGQDLDVSITIHNRKAKQSVNVTLSINGGYRNASLIIRNRSSNNINISQDPNNRSLFIVRALIKANQEELCSCTMKLSN